MTLPGEGVGHGLSEIDLLLQPPAPKTELLEPQSAPEELLDRVRIGETGKGLEADTPFGTVEVEVYWKRDEKDTPPGTKAEFRAPLGEETDAPAAAQRYPSVTMPDGALYDITVRAPLEVCGVGDEAGWSEGTRTDMLAGAYAVLGAPLGDIKQAFPSVDVGDLPDGNYTVTAVRRTRPRLGINVRVEDGEPLLRRQVVDGDGTNYTEMRLSSFGQSGLRPDTGITAIGSRITLRNGEDADSQRLKLKVANDGYERGGEAAEDHSGQVEVIVTQGEETSFTDFTFTQANVIKEIYPLGEQTGEVERGVGPVSMMRKAVILDLPGDDLIPRRAEPAALRAETRYVAPKTIKVSLSSNIRDMKPVAAFRFALTGAAEAADA